MTDALQERTFTIQNKRGLHARAAAKFAATANAFECEIEVERNGQSVPGRSIMGLMMLAASTGTEITVRAQGDDAGAALDAIEALITGKFEED
jgi:phosphocarrier protein HPr